MTRLIVLNRYFFPDLSATSQLLSDLMFHLSASAVDVHVITSRQLYDNPQRKLPATDVVHDVAKLGWQPKIKLSEGLKPTVQYFRGNDF